MPKDYATRILVAVSGLSPQVVTETLYALAVAPEPEERPFVPTKIRLVTTAAGARLAERALLDRDNGWFHRLRAEYRLPPITFAPEHIVVLEDGTGKPLDDIRSRDDNRYAADAIVDLIGALTCDDDSALHVSIAGGRKTMGFCLGYALSLYGRPQDRLSHVLVNAPFESLQDFYYPAPQRRVIRARDGRQYDAHDARVTLADIPFVRLRTALGRDLLARSVSFSSAVKAAQRALPPVGLKLHPATCTVAAGGETFKLKPSKFALYWLLAERALHGQPGVHWSEDGFKTRLLDNYGRLQNPYSADYERAEAAFARGRPDKIVNPAKAHINRILRQCLGEKHAAPYLIVSLEPIPGTRRKRFGLTLPPSAIQIGGSKP